jgi:hypothetical protein
MVRTNERQERSAGEKQAGHTSKPFRLTVIELKPTCPPAVMDGP